MYCRNVRLAGIKGSLGIAVVLPKYGGGFRENRRKYCQIWLPPRQLPETRIKCLFAWAAYDTIFRIIHASSAKRSNRQYPYMKLGVSCKITSDWHLHVSKMRPQKSGRKFQLRFKKREIAMGSST
jgi:hypothetical protein